MLMIPGANIIVVETKHGTDVYAFHNIHNAQIVYKKMSKFHEDDYGVHVEFFTPSYIDSEDDFNPNTFKWN